MYVQQKNTSSPVYNHFKETQSVEKGIGETGGGERDGAFTPNSSQQSSQRLLAPVRRTIGLIIIVDC